MRYLVISDIHANWEALEAVLADSKGLYDQILNCGDLVGYGPDPNRVVDWCRENVVHVVRGNHDKACVGLEDLEWFNPIAKASAVWTHEVLTEENRRYLLALAKGPVPIDPEMQILHGSPADEDEYLIEIPEVRYASRFLDRNLSFFGHTHVQGGFVIHRNGIGIVRYAWLALEQDVAYLINPGSVGQPRDNDPRAAYAIYDSEDRTVEYRRATYNIPVTQEKIVDASLPELLAARLEFGR